MVGVEPMGRSPQGRSRMVSAVRLNRHPIFSFAGVRRISDEFAGSCLGPALLFAAHRSTPVAATELDAAVSAVLHHTFREIGVLLPDYDSNVVLGASDDLLMTLGELDAGQRSPVQLAGALGVSTTAAESRLAVLAHWGLAPSDSKASKPRLAVAA